MPKLYMFYLGGNAGRSNIEVHDIQFAVCDNYQEAVPALKAAWFGDAGKIHIDGWQIVEWADGYDITVSEQPAGDERPSENTPRLYFANVGGYLAGQLAEAHAIRPVCRRKSCRSQNQSPEHPFTRSCPTT